MPQTAATYTELADLRTYWQGLAEDAINTLRDLEGQSPGISGRRGNNLAALDARHDELVARAAS